MCGKYGEFKQRLKETGENGGMKLLKSHQYGPIDWQEMGHIWVDF